MNLDVCLMSVYFVVQTYILVMLFQSTIFVPHSVCFSGPLTTILRAFAFLANSSSPIRSTSPFYQISHQHFNPFKLSVFSNHLLTSHLMKIFQTTVQRPRSPSMTITVRNIAEFV